MLGITGKKIAAGNKRTFIEEYERRTSKIRVPKLNKKLRKLCREAAELFQLVNKKKPCLA